MRTASESLGTVSDHMAQEGMAQERRARADSDSADLAAKKAIAALEAAQAMGRAAEQMKVASMKIADMDSIIRMQAQQLKRLRDDVETLKSLLLK